MVLVSRPSSGQLREGLKKIINFMEFSKLAGPPPPPYFGKLLRMTCCFDLWHLKVRGVTFNDSLFWSGKGEGGVINMKFFIQFLDVSG